MQARPSPIILLCDHYWDFTGQSRVGNFDGTGLPDQIKRTVGVNAPPELSPAAAQQQGFILSKEVPDV